MKLVCVSDTHGNLKDISLPEGDVLILAGDILNNYVRGSPDLDATLQEAELRTLDEYIGTLKYKKAILVPGNHDWIFEKTWWAGPNLKNIKYLHDNKLEFEGISFYGSGWQPEFCGWAFNVPRNSAKLKHYWTMIPEGVDVLITHTPPYGTLDQIDPVGNAFQSRDLEHLGCELLTKRLEVVKPRVHIFGHIHGSYGTTQRDNTLYINAAICTESYRPTNKPQVVVIEPRK